MYRTVATRLTCALLLAGFQLAARRARAQEPPGAVARAVAEAGDLRLPANRAVAVAAIRAWQSGRKTLAWEQGRLLGLPLREEKADGGVRELMDWGADGRPLYITTLNANAAISTASSVIRVAPYFATGAGDTVGVWDAGSIRATHQEFGGRVVNQDAAAVNYHSTHVGGTIGATGIVGAARGMAPDVRIDSYDWTDDFAEMTDRGAAVSAEAGKIYVSNHSYGYLAGWDGNNWLGTGTTAAGYENDFGCYNIYARDTDSVAFNLPYYLIFWAAGNDRDDKPATGTSVTLDGGTTYVSYDPALHPPGDGVYRSGYENIGFNALAKNVVTVGAMFDAVVNGVRSTASVVMSSFSCWGPTDDGRIKPDLVANGTSLYSTYLNSDSDYASMSGTSMAAPNAAGTAQQLVSYYRTMFNGPYMRASTLKGLLIHSADDLGTPGPDYKHGWGLINAQAAADLIAMAATNPLVPRLIEHTLTTVANTQTHTFGWNGTAPIRATLCWTDPAGTATDTHDDRTPRLVNNLDLRIIGPDGTTYYPFVMPFVGAWTVASMSAAATNGVNSTDNVEQVLIAAPPTAGEYRAVVSAAGALSGYQQAYSLLLSGTAPPPPIPLAVTPDWAMTGSVAVAVSGAGFAPAASVSFYRDGYAPVGATVTQAAPANLACNLDADALATGLWNLRVTNPDGQTGALSNAFTRVTALLDEPFELAPSGWTASANLGSTYWALTAAASHTPPNAWFAAGPAARNTDNLYSPVIAIPANWERLRIHFWHRYNIISGDGCVLEVSPDGGSIWNKIDAAGSGATFVQGGYTGVIPGGNPVQKKAELAGSSAWTGNSGSAFTEVIVALDSSVYTGTTFQARWRLSTDASTASPGWFVDSVLITGYDPTLPPPTSVPDPATILIIR